MFDECECGNNCDMCEECGLPECECECEKSEDEDEIENEDEDEEQEW